MRRIFSCQQYAETLAMFRKNKSRCVTNKLLMCQRLTAEIDSGKVWTEQCGETLWFFFDELDYYSAQFYVPFDKDVEISQHEKVAVVDLTGNKDHYDDLAEKKILEAGFKKYQCYLELSCVFKNCIDEIVKRLIPIRLLATKQGFICRRAERKDYSKLRTLWIDKIGKDRFVLPSLTEEELDEMEKHGRCVIILDQNGELLAADNYWVRNGTAYGHISSSYRIGLGGWCFLERLLRAYEEGCTRDISWIPTNNVRSMGMVKTIKKPTGKFFWQFIY